MHEKEKFKSNRRLSYKLISMFGNALGFVVLLNKYYQIQNEHGVEFHVYCRCVGKGKILFFLLILLYIFQCCI